MNINKYPLVSIFFSPLKEGVRWNVCWKGCVISIISIHSYISIGFAQITLDSSNFPVPGLSLNRFYAWAEPDSINFGNPGPAQSYDFSNSHIIINDSINYLDATLTPFTNEHSGAVVALQTADEINYKSYDYFTYDNNAYWHSGITIIAEIEPGIFDTLHGNHLPSDVDTLLSDEYSYGFSKIESSKVTVYVNPWFFVDFHKIKDITVDGWGTLNTPFDFFDDVLRIKYIEYKYDSVFGPDSLLQPTLYEANLDTLYYYHYYAMNIRHPVVILHTNQFDKIEYFEIIKIPSVICGCTDEYAVNYNPLANEDDGSCIYCDTISYTITPDTNICSGDSVILEVTGGNSWLWSNGDTTSSISLQPGSSAVYSVYISNQPDCWELATVEVSVHPDVNAGFWVNTGNLSISDSILFVNTSLNATDYFWDFDDDINGTSTEVNPKHLYSSTGSKNVKLIASNYCSINTFSYTITILSIDEIADILSDFKVYPNPGNDAIIEFYLNKKANIELSIVDIFGRRFSLVSTNNIDIGKYQYNINSIYPNLSSAIYIILLNVEGKTYQCKWVKIE